MGFFDSFPLPEPPKPPRRPRSQVWQDPGLSIVPATLVVDGLLVRRPEFAVFANDFHVYPYGFEFEVSVLRRPRPPGENYDVRSDSPFRSYRRAGGREAGADRDLRFGVQFADGRAAATEQFRPVAGDARPEPPTIKMRGGHGGNGRWQQTLWVWGLPEEGDVDLVYSWPAEDVSESRLELDGDRLRAAAGRAVVLWEEPEADEEEDDDVAG